ncbi:MAG: KH domain-containing protein [Caldilineales bacterium]
MKDLVQYIAENLVDDVEQVRVKEVRTANGLLLELRVAREDMGRVIGSSGRVANAMRAVMRVPAMRQGKIISLEIT